MSPARRPHVVLVCISLRSGGTERIVSRIANHMATSHTVTILTLAPTDPFYSLDKGIQVISPKLSGKVGFKPYRVMMQLLHLFRSLRRQNPECCLIFGEDIAGISCIAARLVGISRVIVLFRGTPERSLRGINGLINPILCRLAECIVVQTETGKQRLVSRYPLRRLTVLPNPIDVPMKAKPMEERDPVTINVGSLGRQKNQEGLIRIFSRLPDRVNWKLVFIGDGADRNRLEQLSDQLDIQNSVDFVGETKEVRQYYNSASIFAFTSLSEGFPNALAEALAAGCSCISYDCPTGPSDLITHMVNGILVDTGNEAGFVNQLQELINNPELRSRLSGNARTQIIRFESNIIMKRFENMINRKVQVGNTHPCDY